MIKNTKAAVQETIKSLKRLDFLRVVMTLFIAIGYISYRLAFNTGLLGLNVLLLSLHSAYLVFYVTINAIQISKEDKTIKKGVLIFYKWSKRLIQVLMAYVTLIGVLDATDLPNKMNIIFAILLPIALVLQIVFDVIVHYISIQLKLIQAGIEADIDKITKPFKHPIEYSKQIISNIKNARKEESSQDPDRKKGKFSLSKLNFKRFTKDKKTNPETTSNDETLDETSH